MIRDYAPKESGGAASARITIKSVGKLIAQMLKVFLRDHSTSDQQLPRERLHFEAE